MSESKILMTGYGNARAHLYYLGTVWPKITMLCSSRLTKLRDEITAAGGRRSRSVIQTHFRVRQLLFLLVLLRNHGHFVRVCSSRVSVQCVTTVIGGRKGANRQKVSGPCLRAEFCERRAAFCSDKARKATFTLVVTSRKW